MWAFPRRCIPNVNKYHILLFMVLTVVVYWEIFQSPALKKRDTFSIMPSDDSQSFILSENFNKNLTSQNQVPHVNNSDHIDVNDNHTKNYIFLDSGQQASIPDNRIKSSEIQGLQQNRTSLDIQDVPLDQHVHYRKDPYPAYWVHGDLPFLERLILYNAVISKLRKEIWTQRGFRSWSDPSGSPAVLWGSRDDFLKHLGNFTQVKTVALAWLWTSVSGVWSSLVDDRNLLIQTYYGWAGSEPLCTWINTPGFTKARWDAVYNKQCNTDIQRLPQAQSLEPVYLHGKPINPDHYWPNKGLSYPEYFYTTPPHQALHMHIAEDVIITAVGDIFTGNLKLVPYSCSHDISPGKPPGYATTSIYSEVFIMSGHWGSEYFHKTTELYPRGAPYIDFLLDNPSVMIHVSETAGRTAQILGMLGLSRDRFVTGVVRAKLVFLPQATPCGFTPVHGAQILSHLYRNYIYSTLTRNNQTHNPDTGNRYLIMIHRSGSRRLTGMFEIERNMKTLAENYDLEFVLFHDQQLPSLEDTMVLFNQAVMVVAPHGAGESNLLFCQPGTYVIEAVCNPPHVNMCYQRLAHVLGLRYHGIPSEDGCEDHIKINPKVIEFVVRAHLELRKQMLDKERARLKLKTQMSDKES